MSQANQPRPCRNQGESREVRAKQMSGRVAACESRRSAAGGTLDLAPNCAAERRTGGVCPRRETHRGRTFRLCRRRRTSLSGATYVCVGGERTYTREREPSPDKAAAMEVRRSPFQAVLCRRPPAWPVRKCTAVAGSASPAQALVADKPLRAQPGADWRIVPARANPVVELITLRGIKHKPSVRCRTDNRGP